jgi:DnaJ like chaperone protein
MRPCGNQGIWTRVFVQESMHYLGNRTRQRPQEKGEALGLLGALVGGSLGFMLGGPLGAMVGGVLGSQVGDPRPEELRHRSAQPRVFGRCPSCRRLVSFTQGEPLVCPGCGVHLSTSAGGGFGAGPFGDFGTGRATGTADAGTAQSAFMVALISLAAKVAKADGQVSPEEIAAFDDFLRQDLGMNPAERRLAARIFNQARDSTLPASAFAQQLRGIMRDQPDRLRDLISILLKIAWADGRLDPAEEKLIRGVAADLGLTGRDYEEAAALFSRGNLNSAYALLGLSSDANPEEIRRSYRRLAREYHPDTMAAKGLPEDFLKFANEKLQAINEAYGQIRRARGF